MLPVRCCHLRALIEKKGRWGRGGERTGVGGGGGGDAERGGEEKGREEGEGLKFPASGEGKAVGGGEGGGRRRRGSGSQPGSSYTS